jgi:hypothetical protein
MCFSPTQRQPRPTLARATPLRILNIKLSGTYKHAAPARHRRQIHSLALRACMCSISITLSPELQAWFPFVINASAAIAAAPPAATTIHLGASKKTSTSAAVSAAGRMIHGRRIRRLFAGGVSAGG